MDEIIVIQAVRIIFGAILVLFLPGYLLTLILFRGGIDRLERFVFSVVLSACIDVSVGLLLGLNEETALVTGGITESNILLSLTLISLILFLIHKYLESVKT